MEDIIKTVKPLEDFSLLWKGVTETVQNEVKEQEGGFLSYVISYIIGASLLGHILADIGNNGRWTCCRNKKSEKSFRCNIEDKERERGEYEEKIIQVCVEEFDLNKEEVLTI